MTGDDFDRFAAIHPSGQPARPFTVHDRTSVMTDTGPDIAALAGQLDWIADHLADCDHGHPFHDYDCLSVVCMLAMISTDHRCPWGAADVVMDALAEATRATTSAGFVRALRWCADDLTAEAIAEHDDAVHRLTEGDR